MTEKSDQFGPKIKRWRTDVLGLTQQQLADRLGVGIASIPRWESGETEPSEKNKALLLWLMALDPETLKDLETADESDAQGKCSDRAIWSWFYGQRDQCDDAFVWLSKSRRMKERQSDWDDELPAPYPKNAEQKSRVRKGSISGNIDLTLIEKFEEERENRGLTADKLLETILWNYYDRPSLSFQQPESHDEITETGRADRPDSDKEVQKQGN